MTETEIQALEALYKRTHGSNNMLVDLSDIEFPIASSTLDALIKYGLIRSAGHSG